MDILNLHKILENKKQEQAKIQGKLETYLTNLKDLGFDTVKKAESAVKKLTKEIEEMETNYQDDLEKFKEEYSELLEN